MEKEISDFIALFDVEKYLTWHGEYLEARKKAFEIDKEHQTANDTWWELIARQDTITKTERERLDLAVEVIRNKHNENPILYYRSRGIVPVEKQDFKNLSRRLESRFQSEVKRLETQISTGILPRSEILKNRLEGCAKHIQPGLILLEGDFMPIQKETQRGIIEMLLAVKMAQWLGGQINEADPNPSPELPAPALPKSKLVWAGTVKSGIYFFKEIKKLQSPKTRQPYIKTGLVSLAEWISENIWFENAKTQPSFATILKQLKDNDLDPVWEKQSIDETIKKVEKKGLESE